MQFINVFSINTDISFKGIQSFHVHSHIKKLCLEYNRSQICQNFHSYLWRDSQDCKPGQQRVVYWHKQFTGTFAHFPFWGDWTVNEVHSQEHRDCTKEKEALRTVFALKYYLLRASSHRRSSSILDYFPSEWSTLLWKFKFQSFIVINCFNSQHGIFLTIFNLKYFVLKAHLFPKT